MTVFISVWTKEKYPDSTFIIPARTLFGKTDIEAREKALAFQLNEGLIMGVKLSRIMEVTDGMAMDNVPGWIGPVRVIIISGPQLTQAMDELKQSDSNAPEMATT